MDVDNDVEGTLLQQFSSLGTTDKDVLIAEFQKLLGNQLNPAGCAFFLDMNSWNLQAAVCSYYDFEQPSARIPSMAFIKDVTIGEGESVPPFTRFTKTWRLQNSGNEPWPPGCCLKFCHGDQLSHLDRVMVETLTPGQMSDISVDMISPPQTAMYQGQWRMCSPNGNFFGEVIWVILTVEESGVLGVTQQLSKFGNDLVLPTSREAAPNPFASPQKHKEQSSDPDISMIAHHGSPCQDQLPNHHEYRPSDSPAMNRTLFEGSVISVCTDLVQQEPPMSADNGDVEEMSS